MGPLNESDFQHTIATLSFHPILPVSNLVSYIGKSIIIKIVSDLKNDHISCKCKNLPAADHNRVAPFLSLQAS